MTTPTLPAPTQQIGHGHAAGRDDPLAVAPATATDVLALQNARGLPAVSVLLSTTPAPRMTPPDSARLNMLLREAERRLALDARPTASSTQSWSPRCTGRPTPPGTPRPAAASRCSPAAPHAASTGPRPTPSTSLSRTASASARCSPRATSSARSTAPRGTCSWS